MSFDRPPAAVNLIDRAGVTGNSTLEYGARGTSKNSYGVYGLSNADSTTSLARHSTAASGASRVRLAELEFKATEVGDGGYFTTSSGNGVVAVADTGTGLYSGSTSGNALGVVASGSADAMDVVSSKGIGLRATGGSGYGILANIIAVLASYGKTASGNGANFSGTYIAVIGRTRRRAASRSSPRISSNNISSMSMVAECPLSR